MITFIYVDTSWKFYLLQYRLKDGKEWFEKICKDWGGGGGYWKQMFWCLSNRVPTDLYKVYDFIYFLTFAFWVYI